MKLNWCNSPKQYHIILTMLSHKGFKYLQFTSTTFIDSYFIISKVKENDTFILNEHCKQVTEVTGSIAFWNPNMFK